MWGTRVIVPPKLRTQILQTLHKGHTGTVKTKGLARALLSGDYVLTKISSTLRKTAKAAKRQLATATRDGLQHTRDRWEYSASPWQRLTVDFAGPLLEEMYLILADVYSKCPEIVKMKSTTAKETVAQIRTLISRMGNPQQLV